MHLDEAGARTAAEQVDAIVASGADPGPFAGVPLGVKDLEDARGMPTSMGSRLYLGRTASSDSLHVARLRAAGAVPVGKTAAPELGALNHTRSDAWGTTRNPWDTRPDARRFERGVRRRRSAPAWSPSRRRATAAGRRAAPRRSAVWWA